MAGEKIILIGYRCTGKTVIGKELARALALPFFDTDELVERRAGKSIGEIVGEEGWPVFRRWEKEVILSLGREGRCVVATGGGAILDAENAFFLKKQGKLIWLYAPMEIIVERLKKDTKSKTKRPFLGEIHDLTEDTRKAMTEREPIYRSLADFSLDTSLRDVRGCVETILASLREREEINGGKHHR